MIAIKLFESLKQIFYFSTVSSNEKMKKPDLYCDVQQLALDIIVASSIEDTESQWSAYIKLKRLCESNENSARNHPFQWEALGDFTTDNEQAIIIYKKALDYAEANNLPEYLASVCLAIAERYINQNNCKQARDYTHKADEAANSIADPGLRKETSKLLHTLANMN